MRCGMWVAGVAGLLVLAGCGGVGGAEQRESGTGPVDGAVSRVEIDSDAGDVRLVAGERSSVERELYWVGDAKPEVEQRLDGDVLKITARCPDTGDRCRTSLTVTVPAQVESRVELGAGGIEVTGLSGDQDLEGGGGSVRGTGLGPGSVGARSSAGSVDLTFAEPAARVDAESSAGSVQVRVPAGQEYDVSASTTAGSTRVDVPTRVGAGHRISARSTAGSVTVATG